MTTCNESEEEPLISGLEIIFVDLELLGRVNQKKRGIRRRAGRPFAEDGEAQKPK